MSDTIENEMRSAELMQIEANSVYLGSSSPKSRKVYATYIMLMMYLTTKVKFLSSLEEELL
jgi:hypothetical protein